MATGTGNQNWTIAGGTLQLGNGGTSGAIAGNIVDNGTFAIDRSDTYIFGGNISGTGSFVQMGTGTTVLTGASSYTGPTNLTAGTLQAGAANVFAPASSFTISTGAVLNLNSFNQTIGSLGGAGNVMLGSAILTAGGNNANTTFSGAISGSGGLTKAGSGTLIVSGSNGYTGVTNINGGTLEVDGAITSSSNVTVNGGGKLTGSGTVDPNTITIASGATFAPGAPGVAGTSMTVAGNLAFQSGAMYLVQINPTTASFANVTGTAALAGTVQAVFSSGGYLAKQYDILHSTGLGGSTFTTLATTSLPANFTANLSYTATDVLLNLTSILGQTIGTGSLNQNQQNVANSLNGFFNNGGSLPANFLPVFGLTGPSLGNALSQLDGEDATGAEHAAFIADERVPGPDARSVRLWARRRHHGRARRARLRARSAESTAARHRAGLCGCVQGAVIAPSPSAGPRGAPVSAAAARATAILPSAPTTSPPAPTATPPAWIITTRPTPCWASHSPAAAPTGI